MKPPIRIVIPFRPFEPESDLHKSLADFDWIAALRHVIHSARESCQCDVHVLTDIDTDLGDLPALKYATTQRRLMLWTLDVCARYLESRDCDRDTIMLDVDQLIFDDLALVFDRKADLGVLVRVDEKHAAVEGGQPLLNGVQFWRGKAKKRLAQFYRKALDRALALPESRIVWGADSDAVRALVEPIALGVHMRGAVRVQMLEASSVLEAFTDVHQDALNAGTAPRPSRPVLDFRWKRKPAMPHVFDAAFVKGART